MSDPSPAPQACSQCHTRLGAHRVTITERDTSGTAVSDWGVLLVGVRTRTGDPIRWSRPR